MKNKEVKSTQIPNHVNLGIMGQFERERESESVWESERERPSWGILGLNLCKSIFIRAPSSIQSLKLIHNSVLNSQTESNGLSFPLDLSLSVRLSFSYLVSLSLSVWLSFSLKQTQSLSLSQTTDQLNRFPKFSKLGIWVWNDSSVLISGKGLSFP